MGAICRHGEAKGLDKPCCNCMAGQVLQVAAAPCNKCGRACEGSPRRQAPGSHVWLFWYRSTCMSSARGEEAWVGVAEERRGWSKVPGHVCLKQQISKVKRWWATNRDSAAHGNPVMQLAAHGGASAFSQHTAAAPTALDSKKQRPCRPACDTGRCVQLAMRCSIANTTSSWARDRKVPHDVRMGSSEIEPSGFTTVLRATCGLAICAAQGWWAALAYAGASSGTSWAAWPSALASADLPCAPSQQPQYAHL